MFKILLVEDDQNLGEGLRNYLNSEGLEVDLARSCEEFFKMKIYHDLILLDWNLGDGQGIDLLTHIRKENKSLPVIMITAKTDLIDKVLGLESGSSDYITKPFEPRELLARIRVQLRNFKNYEDNEHTINDGLISINVLERTVTQNGKLKSLTKKEFDLLVLLVTHPKRAFSREELLNTVWGYEHFPTTRTVDNHIKQLRSNFGDQTIETIRGIGYRYLSQSQ